MLLAIPLMITYTEKLKSIYIIYLSPMFIIALFSVLRLENQHWCAYVREVRLFNLQ